MLEDLIQNIKEEFPTFVLAPKSSSFLMKMINIFLWIISFGQNKLFMANYVTTIGHKVYTPTSWDSNWDENTKYVLLRHERIHMRQQKKYTTPIYVFLYLFPFLPAFLAYGRAKLELEAYTESIAAQIEVSGTAAVLSQSYQTWLVSQFTGSYYGWMWPFSGIVKKWVSQAVDSCVDTYAQNKKEDKKQP